MFGAEEFSFGQPNSAFQVRRDADLLAQKGFFLPLPLTLFTGGSSGRRRTLSGPQARGVSLLRQPLCRLEFCRRLVVDSSRLCGGLEMRLLRKRGEPSSGRKRCREKREKPRLLFTFQDAFLSRFFPLL